MRRALCIAMLLGACPPVAAEQEVALKPGAGLATVDQVCAGCHSLDYVRMNAPFLTADGWKAEVTKMRSAYGAPMSDSEAAAVQLYLATSYGPSEP